MIEYPTTLPTDAVQVVIDKLRGKDVALSLLAKASWNLQGFGMSQLVPGTQVTVMATSWSETELADKLQVLAQPQGRSATAVAIPWEIVLPLLLDLVRRWLGERPI